MEKDAPLEVEFDDDYKARLIKIIEKAYEGKLDSTSEAAMLFHWKRHENDPAYSFVPEKYRGYK
jgi:hypothetical protein